MIEFFNTGIEFLNRSIRVVVDAYSAAYILNGYMLVYYRIFAGNNPDSRRLETILHDLDAAGFKDVILITDRGYESITNLELYIDKSQSMIMGTKIGQKHVQKQAEAFGMFDHHPEGMEIYSGNRIYYKQFDLEYKIEGRRDNVKQADRLQLNLYFSPVRRSSDLLDLDIAITIKYEALDSSLQTILLWMTTPR